MSQIARVLCEGLYFGEGPRWREGRLWFSDTGRPKCSGWPGNYIKRNFDPQGHPGDAHAANSFTRGLVDYRPGSRRRGAIEWLTPARDNRC